MTDPFRLRVLKALTTTIQGVTPANGYQFDLSTSVFRGRMHFGSGDPLPMVSILEVPLQESPRQSPPRGRVVEIEWDLWLQGFIEDDLTNPSDPAHYLMAEVRKVLQSERQRKSNREDSDILGMGLSIVDLWMGAGIVRPPEEHVSEKANFWLPLTVQMVENVVDPYA